LFISVQCAGGAWLIWLGCRIWMSPARGVEVRVAHEPSWRANYLSGLLVTLANPKAILFYLGLLPGFVDLDNLSRADVSALALIITLVLGSVMLAYACAAGQAHRLLNGAKARRIMNAAASGIMLAADAVVLVKAALS
jgi:threonine/homoserine/homoserine lactone efflux protein